jgi:hypothetical protein
MDAFGPLKEFSKWLLDAGFRYTLKKLAKLPIAIARSPTQMRLVILCGMALLSLILLGVTVYIIEVNEAARSTEDLANNIALNIRFRVSGAAKVAEATEWLIKNKSLSDNAQLIQTLPWIKSSEISGIALISDKGFTVLYGKLDPSYDSSAWENIRWNQLRNKSATEVPRAASQSLTLFLGLERRYRTKQDFNQGHQLTGSLVLSRVWSTHADTWEAVTILLPVQSFSPLLRLGLDQYDSGDYDYLVDNDGFILAHPNPFLIYGTDADGRDLKGASNFDEVGKFPLNTRDSDWISGTDTLTKAFAAMISRQPTTVVYKNLRNQYRLTSFRLVDLDNVQGKTVGVVAGRGLTRLEALTMPILLRYSSRLQSVLWATAGVYVLLLSGWLAIISQLTSLHMDLLAWSQFMSPSTAISLGLLPIPTDQIKDYHLSNMVAIDLSLEVTHLGAKDRDTTLEVLDRLCTKLQTDGWIIYTWTLRSVIACRLLAESIPGGKLYFWSPTNVVDYLRGLADFQSLQVPNDSSGTALYRVVYGIGDINIRVGRIAATRQAHISLLGNCIVDILHYDEELGEFDSSSQGVLMYPIEEAVDAGLQIVGDKVTVNSRTYGKLLFGKQAQQASRPVANPDRGVGG